MQDSLAVSRFVWWVTSLHSMISVMAARSFRVGLLALPAAAILISTFSAVTASAGEAHLVLPDVGSAEFMGYTGRQLLMSGLVVCASARFSAWRCS